MSTERIIKSYFTVPGVLSEEPLRVGLQRALEAHQKRLGQLQAIQIGTILVLLLIGIVALGLDLVAGAQLRIALIAAAGISVPTLLGLLRQTIKDWSEASLFLTLVRHSDEQEARDLLKKYAEAKAN